MKIRKISKLIHQENWRKQNQCLIRIMLIKIQTQVLQAYQQFYQV
ncbi:hypothetical protein HMPREF3224_00591 [Anaerococcus hydrogenalis]|nr:hypothetical protein HMPREF3224_00591 [Anaerococcus hydrogenalis]